MAVPVPVPPGRDAASIRLLRAAMWVAIGALVAAALICVVWVLLGPDNDIIGKAFLTVLLLAAFAGAAILDAHLAPRRAAWVALTSMVIWVVVLLIGAFLIWMPEGPDFLFFGGAQRFFDFVLIVGILQLAFLHVRLYLRAHERFVTPFTHVVAIVTIALVALLAVTLVVPLVLGEFVTFPSLYWRIVVATAILAAVGTALLPLVRALFAPKRERPAAPAPVPAPPGWPTYADGRTPLPALAGGVPDWQAYYTGRPSAPVPTAQAPLAPTGYAAPAPAPATAVAHPAYPAAPPPLPLGYGPSSTAPAWPKPPAQTAQPLPPPPTTPFAGQAGSASLAQRPTPVGAREHGWWGGQAPADGAEPTMRWADDGEDWKTEPARRQTGRTSRATG